MFLHVATVGTGQGVERSVIFAIEGTNPRYVLLLVTPEAQVRVEKILRKLDEMNIPYEVVECKEKSELNTIFDCYRRAITEVMERLNVLPRDVVVDFTRGTKAMSAAAVYIAVELGLGKFVYVDGWDRDEETGKVVSGSEKLEMFEPSKLSFHRDLNVIIRYFNTCRFQQGREFVNQLIKRNVHPGQLRILHILDAFFIAYGLWDEFNLNLIKGAFRCLVQELKNFDKVPEQVVKKVTNHSTLIHRISKNPCDRLWPAVFVTSAERWVKAGRIDFAVALLYRMIEYLAHVRLQERGLNPSGVPLEKLSETLREKYKPFAEEGKLRLGLRRSYELLADLGDDYAREFLKAYLNPDHPFRKALDRRNHSVLAHGIVPVDRKVYEELHQWAESSLRQIFGKHYQEDLETCRFPILKPEWFET